MTIPADTRFTKFFRFKMADINVNENYESSIPGVYAAGDIIQKPWLAHVATYEAVQAVQECLGMEKQNV